MNLSLETVISTDRLDELHDEWNALLIRSESKDVSLTHEWLSTFWRSYNKGKELRVVTVRKNGELVCVAPFWESTVSLFDRWPLGPSLRRLGSFLYNPLCDFISAGNARPAIELVWEHLLQNPNAWDFLEVHPMPMLSPPLIELEGMARAAGFRIGLRELAPCPFTDTSGTWESYLATRSSNWRRDRTRREQKAAEQGGVDVLCITNIAELDRYLPIALEIEASGWKGKTGEAILKIPEACSFCTAFASLAARNGWLRLRFLRTQTDELIAFQYGFMFDGVLYAEKIGYLEQWSSIAPGKFLMNVILEECFRGPARQCVLQAPPSPFKMRFATGLERRFRLRIYNRNPKGFILFAADCILIPLFERLRAIARSRSIGEFSKRVIRLFRDNLFDLVPMLVYERDLRSIGLVSPKLPSVTFEVAPADEMYDLARDPGYLFSREEALDIPELAKEGDVCIAAKIGKEVVFFQWVQVKRHMLSEGRILNLGGQKPFIFRWGTISKYRGKCIFPAGLTYTYEYLRSRGFRKCYVDVSGRDHSSICGIGKSGAKLIGKFHILKILGKRRAFVPKRLLKRVSVGPYWGS